MGTLSGGNQQKVIVAREMSRPLKLLSPPSRPAASTSARSSSSTARSSHERDVGTAVLLVSSELDEVLALADRIAVMYRGRILAIVAPDTPREEIGLLMAGITEPATERRHERATATASRHGERELRGEDRSEQRRLAGQGAGDRPGRPRDALATSADAARPTAEASRPDRRQPFLRRRCGARNTVTVTVLAILLAMVIGGVLIVVSDPNVPRPVLATSSARPGDASQASWTMVSEAYANLFKGSIVDPDAVTGWLNGDRQLAAGVLPDLRDADLRRAADLHRSGGGAGLPRRPVQHRRPGPGHHGRVVAGAGRLRCCTCRSGCTWSSRCSPARSVGGALGLHRPASSRPVPARTRSSRRSCSTTSRCTSWAGSSCRTASRTRTAPTRSARPVDDSRQAAPTCSATTCGSTSASCSPCWPPGRWPGCSTARTFGFELRAVGPNPDAARTAGMSVGTTSSLMMALAGALAGLGGTHAGARHRPAR